MKPRPYGFCPGVLYGALVVLSAPLAAQSADPKSSGAPPAESDLINLSAYTVQGQRETGYQATTTVSASRLNIPLKEVPLNIAVLTEDFVMDSVNFNHRDALRWHAGVDDKSIRGFGTEEFFRNGFLHFSDVSGYMVNRIEIIRGPTAVLNGPLTPGGAINFITKQAGFGRTGGEIRTVLGGGNDHDRFNAYFDYNLGAIRESDFGPSLAARFVYAYQYATGAARGTDYQLKSLLPSLKWRPTRSTTITLEYYGYDVQDRTDRTMGKDILFNPGSGTTTGVRPIAEVYGIPYKTGWYGPDAEIGDNLDDMTVSLTQQFGDQLLLDLGYNRHARDFIATPGTQPPIQAQSTFNLFLRPGATAGSTNPADYRLERELQMFNLDSVIDSLHGALTWLPAWGGAHPGDHRIQVGLDTVDLTRAINRDRPFRTSDPTQVFRDVFEVAAHASDDLRWTAKNAGQFTYRRVNALRDELEQSNLYVNWHGKWLDGRLVTLAGYYRADIKQGQRNYLNGTFTTQYDGGKGLPQLGAVWFITDDIGLYANYSESLRVSGPNRANVEDFLPPTRGEMIDVGAKLEFLDDRLILNASYYAIQEVDRSQEFPLNSGLFASVGEVESRGIDVDLFWYPMKNWTIMASYAGNFGVEIKADANAANVGRNLSGYIREKYAVWTKYSFGDGAAQGLSVGGGFSYRGRQFREYRPFPTEAWWNPVTRLDLFAQYAGKAFGWNYEVAVNVRNLTKESNTSNMTPIGILQNGYRPGTNEPYQYEMDPDVLLSLAVKF